MCRLKSGRTNFNVRSRKRAGSRSPSFARPITILAILMLDGCSGSVRPECAQRALKRINENFHIVGTESVILLKKEANRHGGRPMEARAYHSCKRVRYPQLPRYVFMKWHRTFPDNAPVINGVAR